MTETTVAGFSLDDKLACVEAVIEGYRDAARRPTSDPSIKVLYETLKAIALDIRAARAATGQDGGHIFAVLKGQVERARRSKAQLGYLEIGHQQALANAMIAHWTVISEAFRAAAATEDISAALARWQADAMDDFARSSQRFLAQIGRIKQGERDVQRPAEDR